MRQVSTFSWSTVVAVMMVVPVLLLATTLPEEVTVAMVSSLDFQTTSLFDAVLG